MVGGGPAAAAAALMLARRGAEVILAGRHAPPRRLGEALPPGGLEQLTALGLEPRAFQAAGQLAWRQESAWATARLRETDFNLHPGGYAWQVDRTLFDATLREAAAAAGARVQMGSHSLRVEREGENWVARRPGESALRARLVIDATGRSARIARGQGATRTRSDRLVALAVDVPGAAGARSGLLIEAIPEGWWYSAMSADGGGVAVLFTDADLVPLGRVARADFWLRCWARARFASADRVLPSELAIRSAPAGTSLLGRTAGAGWIAAGDAAAAFDPLSSLGLSHALEGGRLASIAAEAALVGAVEVVDAYRRYVERQAETADRIVRSLYRLEGRWPDAAFWRRRRGSDRPTGIHQ